MSRQTAVPDPRSRSSRDTTPASPLVSDLQTPDVRERETCPVSGARSVESLLQQPELMERLRTV